MTYPAPGERVRAKESLLARWRAGGVSEIACEAARAGGVVDRVEHSPMGWWTVVFVKMDAPAVYSDGTTSSSIEGVGPEDLERT